jgi:CMP-N,N'-diacetyllegionaminic acid synthase
VSTLAVIPARGGSKGLPGKNLVPFLGRPLVTWSVEAGCGASLVDRVVVSTDDPDIADVARRAGAEVPFLRPPELATDDVPDFPVFEHALEWLERDDGYQPDLVVQLRPTSPLRPDGLVDGGIRTLMREPNADSLRAVCEAPANPYKMWRIENGRLVPLLELDLDEPYNQPRQILPTAYWQIGVLDVIRRETLVEQHSMSGRRIIPIVVDAALAADIDDRESLARAEALARTLRLDDAAGAP